MIFNDIVAIKSELERWRMPRTVTGNMRRGFFNYGQTNVSRRGHRASKRVVDFVILENFAKPTSAAFGYRSTCSRIHGASPNQLECIIYEVLRIVELRVDIGRFLSPANGLINLIGPINIKQLIFGTVCHYRLCKDHVRSIDRSDEINVANHAAWILIEPMHVDWPAEQIACLATDPPWP